MTTPRRRKEDMPRLVTPLPRPARDPKVAAIRDHGKTMGDVATAMNRIADAMVAATEQRKPVDEFFQSATHTLNGSRAWVKKWGLPILVSIPSVLVTVGAISPNAAKALSEFLRAVGAQ